MLIDKLQNIRSKTEMIVILTIINPEGQSRSMCWFNRRNRILILEDMSDITVQE